MSMFENWRPSRLVRRAQIVLERHHTWTEDKQGNPSMYDAYKSNMTLSAHSLTTQDPNYSSLHDLRPRKVPFMPMEQMTRKEHKTAMPNMSKKVWWEEQTTHQGSMFGVPHRDHSEEGLNALSLLITKNGHFPNTAFDGCSAFFFVFCFMSRKKQGTSWDKLIL